MGRRRISAAAAGAVVGVIAVRAVPWGGVLAGDGGLAFRGGAPGVGGLLFGAFALFGLALLAFGGFALLFHGALALGGFALLFHGALAFGGFALLAFGGFALLFCGALALFGFALLFEGIAASGGGLLLALVVFGFAGGLFFEGLLAGDGFAAGDFELGLTF